MKLFLIISGILKTGKPKGFIDAVLQVETTEISL